jgi:hypothetical protein
MLEDVRVLFILWSWESENMARWIVVTFLIGCLAAEMYAQTPKAQGSAEPTSAADPAVVAQTSAGPRVKTEFPLDAFTEFSAVMVGSRMQIGEGTDEAHIYRSGDLLRMEGPEGNGYLLTDLKKLETYGVSTGACMHDNHPYFRASPWAAGQPGTTVERAIVGKEVLDGHSCQIEDVTVTSTKAGAANIKMRLWEAEDLQGFPIKMEFPFPHGKHATVRYKNVVLGPQDRSLFIHPKSCGSLPEKTDSSAPKSAPSPKKSPTTPNQ